MGRGCDENGCWDKTQWRGVRKEDRMEIDTAELNALSVEERNHLQKEGHCFNCRKTGHMSHACPTKQDTSKKTAPENQRSTIRITKAKEEGNEKKKMAESVTTFSPFVLHISDSSMSRPPFLFRITLLSPFTNCSPRHLPFHFHILLSPLADVASFTLISDS